MEEKVPILGICLGMQLMGDESEEGEQRGLGWIKGTSVRFKAEDLRVPHMMWNKIKLISESKLFNGLEENSRFYFAHSYYMESVDPDLVIAKSIYGREFVAAIESENIIGVQFHPEKSHKFGMKLLRNFITEY
jgi:glutamine amidotransferase